MILACNFVWGVGDAFATVGEQGILQRRTPDRVWGRVVPANESLVHATLMVAFLAAAPVLAHVGAKTTYLLGGVAAFVAAFMAMSVAGRVREGRGSQTRN